MRFGFIGIGNLGEPVVHNLLAAGHAVAVNDTAPERAERAIAKGAVWAESPAAAAAASEVTVTALPGPPQVAAVVEGPGGIAEGIARGSAWIDMSTTDREQTRGLAAVLAEKGAATVEAGCTGGVDAAWEGHVTLYVGASDKDFVRWKPALDALADQVFHMGPLGSGMVMKLVTNLLSFTMQCAFAEALSLGTLGGLDPARVVEGIKASYARSFVAETDGPKILDGSYDPTFAIGLVAKDAGLGLAMAREFGVPLRLFPVMQEIVEQARTAYGDGAGNLVTARVYEDAAKIAFRPKG
ncbi:MAG: NAD(P)-dependent oxidoreductase [Rhodospirillaceae bacterium]|jgi:3-hydroxyisobutyrate dehydrogenase-like beta-hydroxyacid dehydrogenase|nr:NAD(P)-dependent oxidoreductase [Rhodospirillaceae bacterium]